MKDNLEKISHCDGIQKRIEKEHFDQQIETKKRKVPWPPDLRAIMAYL